MGASEPEPPPPDLSSLLLPVPGEPPTNGAHGAAQPQRQVLDASSWLLPAQRPDLRDEPASELLKQVSGEASSIMRNEAKLAKAELTEKAKDVGAGAGMLGGAGYMAALASLALMLCLIFALATALPAWLAALIVTVVFAAIAGALALTGRKRIKKAGPPLPEQSVESVKQTIETVKEAAKWGMGQTR
ncbi:MAG: hypothetical protein QOK16_4139 [Solirubrobacteraceae bacterium]|jgi:uncharacterized membrane protein YqjE|nr:hypothetical protein [Solirubrobacteraceae bacterium]